MKCKLYMFTLFFLIITSGIGADESKFRGYNQPKINLMTDPDNQFLFRKKIPLDEEKAQLYINLLGLEKMFPRESLFWEYYSDGFDLVNRYYIDDIYSTKLPFNGKMRINISTYIKSSQFMTFSIPLDIESSAFVKKSMRQIRIFFTPGYYRNNTTDRRE